MPVDIVLPILGLLAVTGIIVFLAGAGKTTNRKRRLILFIAFEGILLALTWSMYILPGIMLRSRAEAGDSFAQYRLSKYYYSRFGYLWPNIGEARRWMVKAAENGSPDAMSELGGAYSVEGNWLGLDVDMNKSFHWLTKAADSGSGDAALLLERLKAKRVGLGAD